MMTFVDQTGKTLREGRKAVRLSPCAQDRASLFVQSIGFDWANDAQQSQLGAEAEEGEEVVPERVICGCLLSRITRF